MSKRVCPWWLGYFLASPIRRWLLTDPRKMLSPYVREGMTVLEPGPGMGFFTIDLAKMVGASGRVIAVDIQEKMLRALKTKAEKADVLATIDARLVSPDSMKLDDLEGRVDFTLSYAVVHEMPSALHFFEEASRVSRIGALLFLVEPAGHVSDDAFNEELQFAQRFGFAVQERPVISRCHAAVLKRK